MSVGCPVTSSAFPLHKTMNTEPFLNPNPPIQRQIGIVSLLGSDTNNNTTNHSIKRTLSADMSSPKWLQNNGLSEPSMKRAQSSDRLNVAVEEEGLNREKLVNEDEKKGAFEDIWSSILSQKGSGSGQLPPPYVHPMVKRTTSSLSEKSLEICTESLGSETGSDGFSFPISSEPEDTDKDSETTEVQHVEHVQETPICGPDNDEVNELGQVGFVKGPISPIPSLSPSPSLSLGPRLRSSFPPPLPSLANRNGSNVHMRSHRQNGRLVLEAVEVPSQNCFKAQRHDGRLLLTLAGDDDEDENEDDDVESCKDHLEQEEDVSVLNDDDELEDIDCGDEDQEEDEQEVDDEVVEDGGSCFPTEMVNVQQATTPTLIMSKFKWLNSSRPRNDNATYTSDRVKVDKHKSPLPPRPKMARLIPKDGQMSTATTNSLLNAYEYYWRQSTTTMAVLKPFAGQHAAPQVVEKETNYTSKLLSEHNNGKPNYSMEQEKQEVVVVKGDQREKEGEYLVPFLRGCKEPKRSLLLWEPHCIATS